MSLKAALNLLISAQGRTATISRPGTLLTGTIKVAPSNYGRMLETSSSTVVGGREFVISKDALTAISFGAPKRGDRITDAELGTMTITDVGEMFDFGGPTMGYRVRTG